MNASKEQIESIFGVNVFGTILLTQAVVPYMPKGGRIINITSIASKMGMDALPIYGASKAAVDSLTHVWAKEVCITVLLEMEVTNAFSVRTREWHHSQLYCSRSGSYRPRP
jgi:NAD(P)-dependent dehydrogenase (short-subunit alcohol dehydrogenase family)